MTLGYGTLLLAGVFLYSLDNNALCGLYKEGPYEYLCGTYTIEGIVALSEGIKNSNIRSLR